MTGIVTTQFNSLPNGPSANGNAMASIEFDLVADEIVSIDVNNGAPGQGLSRIESLYVDNTRGGGFLFFVFNDVKRLLIVPPGAEGCYPTYSAASYFRVGQSQSKKGVHVRCKAFACTKHSFERFPGAGGLLQNPLDVNNANGPPLVTAAAGVVKPPLITGWDTKFAGPACIINGNHILLKQGTGPVFISWKSPQNKASALGFPLYFEVTNETPDFRTGGIGFASSDETELTGDFTGELYSPQIFGAGHFNKTIQQSGNYTNNGGNRINAIQGNNSNTVIGVYLDFINHGCIFTINGLSGTSEGTGLGGLLNMTNLALYNMDLFTVPIVTHTNPTYQAGDMGYTMNSLGPFKYGLNVNPLARAWDNPGGDPITLVA